MAAIVKIHHDMVRFVIQQIKKTKLKSTSTVCHQGRGTAMGDEEKYIIDLYSNGHVVISGRRGDPAPTGRKSVVQTAIDQLTIFELAYVITSLGFNI